jgi:hypothetical protein
VARRTLGRVLLLAAWCFPLPPRRSDPRACPPTLASFDLRRAPQGAGLVAAGAEPATPLSLPERPPHQSFLPPRVAKRALRQRQLGAEAWRGGRTLAGRPSAFPRHRRACSRRYPAASALTTRSSQSCPERTSRSPGRLREKDGPGSTDRPDPLVCRPGIARLKIVLGSACRYSSVVSNERTACDRQGRRFDPCRKSYKALLEVDLAQVASFSAFHDPFRDLRATCQL